MNGVRSQLAPRSYGFVGPFLVSEHQKTEDTGLYKKGWRGKGVIRYGIMKEPGSNERPPKKKKKIIWKQLSK